MRPGWMLVFISVIYTELQKAREEEKQVNSVKLSFEKQLQNERTLKIQVRDRTPTRVWKACIIVSTFPHFLYSHITFISYS